MTTPATAPAPLRVLGEEGARAIQAAAFRILEQTGMTVEHERALELLDAAGCQVDHAAKRVRYPGHVIEEKVALLPRETTYHGIDPSFDATLTLDGPIQARHAGGATNYIDLETGENRRARLEDWRQMATLLDAMPNVVAITTLHVGDVPPATGDLHSVRVALASQRRCVISNAFSAANHLAVVDMIEAVAGSAEAFRARPFAHHMLSPISPLFLQEDDTEQLLACCERGIPTDVPIMPIMGATAPITLAGGLAQSLAEFLGTVVLAQSAAPGHPMPFFVDPVVADMRSGAALFAAPEVGLLVAGISQLGRELYGMPPQAIGLDADGFDRAQTMFQKAQMTIFQVMAGGRLLIGAGTVEATMANDPVQLVLDDEITRLARRWDRGLRIDDEALAVDVIGEVGPRGEFLSADHTLDHLHDGELVTETLFARGSRGSFLADGGRSIEQRARDRARAILASHEVPPLPDVVVRELDAIVARAEKVAVAR